MSRTALFHRRGPRTRRLASFLRRRARTPVPARRELDKKGLPILNRPRAVVFTDTADFTVRTQRFGILHFLMAFHRVVAGLWPVIRQKGGTVVKVEADSLLLSFADVEAACAAVLAMARTLRRLNRSVPANERFRFSYGIGFGEVIEIEGDMFGLELNLASKLGEDLAYPGEALLTPSAVAALAPRERGRLERHRSISFKGLRVPVKRLPLPRG